MYVRNYGVPPRSVKRDGEPSLTRAVSVEAIADPMNEAPPDDRVATEKHETVSAETTEAVPTFGEHGLPPQRPLKRRAIRRKPKEELPQIPEPATHESTRVCEENETGKTELSTVSTECARNAPPKKGDRPLTTEELFLGSLLILLMGDHASDDILIMLAFLLISGFKLK